MHVKLDIFVFCLIVSGYTPIHCRWIIGLAFAFCILRIYALLQELGVNVNAETLHEVNYFFSRKALN